MVRRKKGGREQNTENVTVPVIIIQGKREGEGDGAGGDRGPFTRRKEEPT
jgi:hypothetical protein